MKTAVYYRVSTKDQLIETQEHEISAYLKFKGITDYEVFQDVGISGLEFQRPGLNSLLNASKQGKVQLLVIYKLDRLGRSLRHLLELLELLKANGTTLVSVKDNLDLSTSAGVLLMHIIGAFAQFERDLISERTISGMANARAKGSPIGRKQTIPNEVREKARELKKFGFSNAFISNNLAISVSSIKKITKVSQKTAE